MLSILLVLISCKSNQQRNLADDFNNQGLLLTDEGRERDAIYAFRQAVNASEDSDPDRGVFLRNLAATFRAAGILDSAKYFYRLAANTYPQDSHDYLIIYANIFLVDNNVDSSLVYLEKAYRIDSSDPVVNDLLGLIYLGDYDRSFYNPDKALQYNLASHKIFQKASSKFVLAKNYYYLNDMERSLRLFREIHEEYPDIIYYLEGLIMVEQEMGNLVGAAKLLDELKTKNIARYNERIEDPIKPGTHSIFWQR